MAFCAVFFALLLLGMWLTGAFRTRLSTPVYTILTSKVSAPFRIVSICDLHDRAQGDQVELLAAKVDGLHTDAIAFGGDLFQETRSHEATVELIKKLAAIAPCYYVSGNHDYKSHKPDQCKALARGAGAKTLMGSGAWVEKGGSQIHIYGVDDPLSCRFFKQLRACGIALEEGAFSILISHRPEYFSLCCAYGFDLALSGHAHGGQWRIPRFLNGVYAPGQGFFPRYAGGLYKDGATSMVVSRGLSDIPRFRLYNPPEIAVVDIKPRETLAVEF